MSCINDVTTTLATSALSSQASSAVSSSSSESTTEDFNTVLVKALQNCNGTRPAHVCCCCDNSVDEEVADVTDEVEADEVIAADTDEVSETDDVTSSEMLSAGSCFTMFIRISARITTEVSETVSGKFKDTTLAFADSLKADKSYSENLLTSYMQKAEENLSAQTAELKSYLTDYIDNMMTAIKSSVSGLNTTLLSSSNLLGDSLSDYSNLLSNSSLLSSSSLLGSSDTSSLASTLFNSLLGTSSSSSSSSLSGYSAIDIANARVTAALSGQSDYTYGIGTSLDTDRYAGRSLSMIRSSEVETTASGGLKMVDTKGNTTTGVAATGIEIGDSSSSTVAKVSTDSTTTKINNPCATTESVSDSTSQVSAVINDADNDNSVKVQLRVDADTTSDNSSYMAALKRKNHIVDMFKDMIMESMSNSVKDSDDSTIKSIDAKVSISFA